MEFIGVFLFWGVGQGGVCHVAIIDLFLPSPPLLQASMILHVNIFGHFFSFSWKFMQPSTIDDDNKLATYHHFILFFQRRKGEKKLKKKKKRKRKN